MKTNLLLILFVTLCCTGRTQTTSEQIKILPTRNIEALTTTIISCFEFKPGKGDHHLGINGSKVRGDHYQNIVQNEAINIRTGQRGQSTNYYINGIRVEQDYTPEEMLEDVNLHFNDTPAAFEGNPWPALLIY